MPKIIGESKENVAIAHGYMKTGFYSMDCAFNPHKKEIGIPYGTLWELYGASHTSKSTTAYSLASIICSNLDTAGWVLCDVEDAFTPEYISTIAENMGMDENSIISIAEGTFHNDKLTDIFDNMNKKNVGVGIVDSLGMLASRAEIEGDLGDANMGKRAFMINQFVRKFFAYKNDLEYIPPHATIFMINHIQQNFGGFGINLPGGTGRDYGAGARVLLSRVKIFVDGSFWIRGKIDKLRWMGGGKGNLFDFVSKVGYGMHKGLSAIIDAKELGLLDINRGVIKVKKKSLGRMSTFLKNHEDEDRFEIFFDLINEHKEEKDE